MTAIKFAGEVIEARHLTIKPGSLRLEDIVTGPNGMLLRVVTVQKNCPYLENLDKVFMAVLLETEDHQQIPVRNWSGLINVWRARR